MYRLWLINQFANTPELPGHTRQFEVAAGLVSVVGTLRYLLLILTSPAYLSPA